MAENPLNNSTEENKPADQPNIEVGNIEIHGDVAGPFIIGHGNIINLPPAEQAFRSLHQLPQPPADFTGRDELIAQLLADFEGGKGATLTAQPVHGLTGMGGIGKTALGLVVAHRLKKDYPNVQLFLDLKGTTTPLSAIDIMRHVILSFEPTADLRTLDEAGMTGAYQTVLDGKRALLFLDNARSADQVAPLRPPKTCAMLMTSRWAFPVSGLHAHRLDVLSQENAEKFLLELCPRIGNQADELAEACAHLPLALRIAGSFLGVNGDWSVDKYLSQLSNRKGRLATLKESRVEAELTTEPDLLATFELSYSGLSEEDRKRWRMLGVFPTSFDASAARAMWETEEDSARKVLGLFLRYSLLDYDEIASRYSLHDLLADYALSQMKTEDEYEARLKHASHYKDVLRAADDLYIEGGEKILTGLLLFDLEWENIQAGQAWVVASQEKNSILAELCMIFPNTGAYVLDVRQHPGERIQWLGAALSVARELGDRRGEGTTLGNLGTAYTILGDTHKAIGAYKGQLVIAREIGDRLDEGSAINGLGVAYSALGNARKAIEFYEQYLAIAQESSDRRGEGGALGNLGSAYHVLGEAHKAIEFYEQALAIARELGDHRGEGNTLGNLGTVYRDLGDARKAIEFYEQHLAIALELGDRRGEGTTLGNLGIAYKDLGDARKAIEFYEQALAIAREIGHRSGEGGALGNLGTIYRDLGDARKAIEFYEQYLAIAREVGHRRAEWDALGNLGNAYNSLGEAHKAIEFYEQALAIARELGDRRGEGATLGNLGAAYKNLGDAHKAIEFYEQHLTIAREIGHRLGEGNAFFNLGEALYDLKKRIERLTW